MFRNLDLLRSEIVDACASSYTFEHDLEFFSVDVIVYVLCHHDFDRVTSDGLIDSVTHAGNFFL